ncbi:FAD-binding oxidoreductase [Bailinhaonella thermotolerans]|uniref:FAD-binding oxidoreductase n=2 Tax=Bailinhaonella thermotolerans TaxID=1070861 RepID=A0A3A4BJF0_9ACTN|nr:FAD-binding oxidoreductase [Bailinhaonella thermotolerans]
MIRVEGSVYRPGDPGYDAERDGFQLHGQHRPDVIVAAAGAADVRAAVEYAVERGLPVAVQASGHGLAETAEGGVLISTRAMDGVRVDPAAGTAWVEAGARWEKVIAEAGRHGLAPPSGSSPNVGAVGYTLGGGMGLLARQYGYAADHVRAFEVVTADGRARQVTPGDELFRALLGGGGNFGVVTGMEIGLLPVARLYGGGLYFDSTAEVLEAWRAWTETVPDELTSAIAMVPLPDAPVIPEPLRGRHVTHVRVAYTGDAESGERLVAPLRSAGEVLMERLGDMPYTESHTISDDPPHPHAYAGAGTLLTELDSAAAFAVAGPSAEVPTVLQVRHLGGALAKPSPAVIGHREARYVLHVVAGLDDPDTPGGPGAQDVEAVRAYQRRQMDALGGVGTFLNFHCGPATESEVAAAYDPDVYQDLRRLKATYDPANTFRLNHNIPPASA